jgi:hypothetical protein
MQEKRRSTAHVDVCRLGFSATTHVKKKFWRFTEGLW